MTKKLTEGSLTGYEHGYPRPIIVPVSSDCIHMEGGVHKLRNIKGRPRIIKVEVIKRL